MSSKSIYTIQPYFYIIQHIPSGMFYAGAKWGKDTNPNNFMQPGGYMTSSSDVNELIKQDGLDSFKIIDIILEEEIKIPFGWKDVYDYETWFLQSQDLAGNPRWMNYHNNLIAPFGSKEFQTLLIKKYGVDHCTKIFGFWEKCRKTNIEKYGVDNPFKSTEIMKYSQIKRKDTMLQKYGSLSVYIEGNTIVETREQTMLEKYGVKQYFSLPEFIENNTKKVKATKLEKYGNEHYNNSKKIAETKLEKYGNEHYNNRKLAKLTSIEKYGVDNPAKTQKARDNLSKLLINSPLILCQFCGRQGKSPSIFSHIKKCEKTVGASSSTVWKLSKTKY